MTKLPRKVEINLAAIPVTGFGGMCMVIASLACAVALPPTRWFMIAAIAAGIVFGGAMILIKRIGGQNRRGREIPCHTVTGLLGSGNHAAELASASRL